MPDISTINGVDVTDISSFAGTTLADGQTIDGQNVALGFSPIITTFNTGSTPTGWTTSYGISPSFSWTSNGNFFNMWGDVGNNSYRLRYSTGFAASDVGSGSWLWQYSWYNQNDPGGSWCEDLGFAFWTGSVSSTVNWVWGANSSRVAVQHNCPTPYIYTNSSTTAGTSSALTNYTEYMTAHVYWTPSISSVTYRITSGQNDWTESGTTRQSPISNSTGVYGTGTTVYIGFSADNDAGNSGNATNLYSCRISQV